MIRRKDQVVTTLRDGLAKLLAKRKIDVFAGFGYLTDPTHVRVVGPGLAETLTAKNIILAMGTECAPHAPDPGGQPRGPRRQVHPGPDRDPEEPVRGRRRGFGLRIRPGFQLPGDQITMTKRSASPIKGLDADIEKILTRTFKKRKYKMLFGDTVEEAEVESGGISAKLGSGKEVKAELALVTVGHSP